MPKCPLCDSSRSRAAWIGTASYDGEKYEYLECAACRSIYLSPMPTTQAMMKMFGEEYQHFHQGGVAHGGPSQVDEVLSLLRGLPAGVFFDYGCGSGALLAEVTKLGWTAVGLDFSVPTAERFSTETGQHIVARFEDLPNGFKADVLNFGDVLAHLNELNSQFATALEVLKNDGYVVVEGTLEANANLYGWIMRSLGRIRRARAADSPPYDVILATAQGQRQFFARHDLREMRFSIYEASHPAPGRIGLSDLTNLRAVALFALRKVSQATSALFPKRFGNRFFYVGAKR
jgi:SAM-dependent methyltransferase